MNYTLEEIIKRIQGIPQLQDYSFGDLTGLHKHADSSEYDAITQFLIMKLPPSHGILKDEMGHFAIVKSDYPDWQECSRYCLYVDSKIGIEYYGSLIEALLKFFESMQ